MALAPAVEASPMVQEIQAHRDDVIHDRVRPDLSQCPQCQHDTRDGESFRRHQARDRWFWVVVDQMVYRVLGLLTSWRCRHCGHTFTLYPPFALPHKRYVLPEILRRSREYVEQAARSYRQGVRERGRPVFHARAEGQEITAESSDEDKRRERTPALAHTTLYRWVTTLGQWGRTLREAVQWIQQRDPATGLCRQLAGFRVSPRKYRTPARRRLLHACRSLCLTEEVFQQTFGVSIFPRFATRSGWT